MPQRLGMAILAIIWNITNSFASRESLAGIERVGMSQQMFTIYCVLSTVPSTRKTQKITGLLLSLGDHSHKESY